MPENQVVVEFVADTSGLQPAVDKLQQMGQVDEASAAIFKATNDQIKTRNILISEGLKNTDQLSASVNEQQAIYNKLVASVKNLSGASKDAVTQLLKLSAGDVAQGFKEAAVNVDDYITVLQGATKGQDNFSKSGNTLRTQILQLTNQLAELKAQGLEGTPAFDQLALKAGSLKNALQETQGVVRNLASESPVLNAFSESVTGLAGAFQAGVGAAALFGDENKDLQATLVKVTSVTAIAQGVQQALTLVNKSGAITTLSLALANKENALQTSLATAAQSENIIISTAATVAMKILNAAIAANPIGLVIVALSAFVAGLEIFTGHAKEAAEAQESLNAAIAAAGGEFDAQVEGLKAANAKQLAELDAQNAKESEKARQQAAGIVQIIRARNDQIQQAESALQTARLSTDKDVLKSADDLEKRIQDLQNQNYQDQVKLDQANIAGKKIVNDEILQGQVALANAQISQAKKNTDAVFAAQRVAANAQLAVDIKNAGDNEQKIVEIKAAFNRKLLDINAAEEAQHEANRQSILTANLLNLQTVSRRINSQISDEETAAQIKILQDRAKAEIALEGTTAAKKLEIQAKLNQDIEELNRQQLIRDITAADQGQIARNNVVIDSVKTTNADRLELEIQNVALQTDIDLKATNLTQTERLAIIAASNQKERELRNQFIQQQAEDQIAQTRENNQADTVELQRQLDAQAEIRNSSTPTRTAALLNVPILNLSQQLAQIDTLTKAQKDQNDALIDANFKKQQSAEDFAKEEVKLEAQGVAITQAGELKKQQAIKDTADFQRKMNLAITAAALDGVAQGLQILQNLYAQQDQAAQDRLDKQKANLQEELDAGTITAKAAAEKQKELDAQDKALKREQARRNKELAIFQAIVGTAQAVIAALEAPPPLSFISAAIAGALGAAQIAVIASQPLPQFKLGKNERNKYEGWGVIGEAGPELWKSGSQMGLAEKASIVWLKKDDTVFTPSQTSAMMNTRIPQESKRGGGLQLDYGKLADAVSKKSSVTLNIDGYKQFIKTENDFTTNLSKRRKWL